MGTFKKDVLHAVSRAGLIVALAGSSELLTMAVKYVSGHDVSGVIPNTFVMAVLGFVQKYVTQQLQKEETL